MSSLTPVFLLSGNSLKPKSVLFCFLVMPVPSRLTSLQSMFLLDRALVNRSPPPPCTQSVPVHSILFFTYYSIRPLFFYFFFNFVFFLRQNPHLYHVFQIYCWCRPSVYACSYIPIRDVACFFSHVFVAYTFVFIP